MIDNEPFILDLRLIANPTPDGIPPVCRMRRALKVLLRSFGIVAKWQDRPASTPRPAQDSGNGTNNQQEVET